MYRVNMNINISLSETDAINTTVVPLEKQIIEDTKMEYVIFSVVDLIKKYNIESTALTLVQVLENGKHIGNISYNGVFWEVADDYGEDFWNKK